MPSHSQNISKYRTMQRSKVREFIQNDCGNNTKKGMAIICISLICLFLFCRPMSTVERSHSPLYVRLISMKFFIAQFKFASYCLAAKFTILCYIINKPIKIQTTNYYGIKRKIKKKDKNSTDIQTEHWHFYQLFCFIYT